eukprot:TRINITY_DN3449_c0_g1_i1.p1 TRINITY_DN3449_c0_g1~~TRINITY_DN3449_c0_g1_i1.p1  ORF type:complete len:323 (+),score=94.89 TRINITY_DN3449_c0_g1_i1:322-1290(+)
MKNLSILLFVFGLSAYLVAGQGNYWGNNHQNPPPATDAVLMESIKALTFNKGENTNYRRTSPIQQLKCVGGSAYHRSDLYPSTVRCTNEGSDGVSIQWKCEADLDKGVKFGKTVVSCEGYTNPNDPYVLKGSCGLEYSLDTTTNYNDNNNNGYQRGYQKNYNQQQPSFYDNSNESSSSFGTFLVLLVFGCIFYGLVKGCAQRPQEQNARFAGYNTDPTGSYSNTNGVPPQSSGWRPGFWSGLGGGSILGWLFNRNRNNYYHQPGPRGSYYSSSSAPGYGYGNSYDSGYNSSYSAPSYTPSSPSRRSSSPTRNATAYATTNNR